METGHYLCPSKWGRFAVLQRSAGQRPEQRSYWLKQLPQILQILQSTSQQDRDSWITQAAFRKPNRRKVNLAHVGTCFVDLDYYNTDLEGRHPRYVLDMVLFHCELVGIPKPSLVIDSGRGLQLKWFHTPLPRQALPRWDAVQTHLCQHFIAFGGDKNSKDASRVLRVVRTTNQKNGRPVKVIWQQPEGFEGTAKHYNFEKLAQAVLPVNRNNILGTSKATKRPKKSKKPGRIVSIQGLQQLSLNSLNWARMTDILELGKMRGGFAEGLREPACFWASNFYALRYSKDLVSRLGEYYEFAAICRQIAPHWDMSKIRDKTGNLYPLMEKHARGETVEFQGKQYSPLYTPKSQFLIDLFEITDDEQRKLTTIHSESIHAEKERERKREAGGHASMDEYNDQRQANKREIIRLISCGMRQADIVKLVGVSKGLVSRYSKELKNSRKASDTKG